MRISIEDPSGPLWLIDWIVAEGLDHPQFSPNILDAMSFDRLRQALPYLKRLKELGYKPHVT